MNAVVYCRVSSKEQVSGTSLESQEIACREFAVRHELSVVRVFVERGESAKFADRTQLLEMLAFCKERAHGIDQLLVWKVDRLARNVGDHFSIKASLLKLGVKVVSVTEPIDGKPEGKLLETILAGFAQFDNDVRAARTLQGMRRKIEEGISPWRAPLGYKSSTRRGAKKTEPDQPDQPTFTLLQQAWNEFASGRYTKSQVLRLMTSRGLRTRNDKWLSKQSLDYVFSDAYYAGVLRDPWSGQQHMGRHMPMVSQATFDTVQKIIARSGRSVPHRAVRPEFPLRALVRCECCEHTLTAAFSRGRSNVYPYYRCYYRDCPSQASYPLRIVHEEFTGYLNSMNKDMHSVGHLKELLIQGWQHRTEMSQALSGKNAIEATRVKEQQQQLIRMMMDQLITEQEFLAQREILASRLLDLEPRAPELGSEPEDVVNDIETVCGQLTDLGGAWDTIATDFKKRFQHLAFPGGYILGRIGTAQKGRLFSFLEAYDTSMSNLVPQTGQSWNQLAEEIGAFAAIFREYNAQIMPDHEA